MQGYGSIVAASLTGIILMVTIFGTLFPLFSYSLRDHSQVIQKVEQHERKKGQTSINIINYTVTVGTTDNMTFWVKNEGSQKIYINNQTQFFLYSEAQSWSLLSPALLESITLLTAQGNPEIVNEGIFDPDEVVILTFITDQLEIDTSYRFKMVTGYGISDVIGFQT